MSFATQHRTVASSRCPASTTGRTQARRSPRWSSPACHGRRPSRCSRASPARGAGSRCTRARSRSSTTMATTRRRSRARSRPCASGSRARVCASSSSRTSTPERATSPRSLPRRSRRPTTSRLPTSIPRASSRCPASPAAWWSTRSATVACSRPTHRPWSRAWPASRAARRPVTCCSSSVQAISIARWSCFVPEENVALSRFTTIGTGGPARWFARPESIDELQEALRWAADNGAAVEVIGLGSNLLVHDDGFDALVLKLSGDLAAAEVEGDTLVMGGGAANAVGLHRARAAGLGGFEFASAIPGTAGGGVRMNAGAYGREWKDVMIDAVVVDAGGPRTLDVEQLHLSYRHSGLQRGEVVASVRFGLEPSSPEAVKAIAAELLAQRKATQPTNRRTFGSVFKNPPGERGSGRLIEEVGLKGHRIGGAVISARHANFIENADGATSADCIALMAEAQRRVHERFGVELEHEVQFLGPLELPPL